MKFCANLSFMFTELPFLSRYLSAKSAGFEAVESGFPFGLTLAEVLKSKNEAKIDQILLNTFTGDVTKGEVGFAAIPGKEFEFRESIKKTLEYAKALNVRKIHVMSGLVNDPSKENDECFVKNLQYCTNLFQQEGIMGLIEPINNYSLPNYFLNSYKKGVFYVETVNSPNLKLMLDLFHMQHICGNITNNIKDLKKYIGHVQIAQVPNRNEPNTPGEINYKYVLETLKEIGYDDWIGLEYKPAGDTGVGLNWISDLGYEL